MTLGVMFIQKFLSYTGMMAVGNALESDYYNSKRLFLGESFALRQRKTFGSEPYSMVVELTE